MNNALLTTFSHCCPVLLSSVMTMSCLFLPWRAVAHWSAFADRATISPYLGLVEAQRAAASGQIPSGRRVLLVVGQSDEINAHYARQCALCGWTFCIAPRPRPGLPRGVWHCEVRTDGKLWPLVEPTAPPAAQSHSSNRLVPTAEPILWPGTCPDGDCR
jgi:hypothetical protein